MFNASLVKFLQWLRSHAAREVFAGVVSKLSVASIVGAGWLFASKDGSVGAVGRGRDIFCHGLDRDAGGVSHGVLHSRFFDGSCRPAGRSSDAVAK